jgi:hypothetical protein
MKFLALLLVFQMAALPGLLSYVQPAFAGPKRVESQDDLANLRTAVTWQRNHRSRSARHRSAVRQMVAALQSLENDLVSEDAPRNVIDQALLAKANELLQEVKQWPKDNINLFYDALVAEAAQEITQSTVTRSEGGPYRSDNNSERQKAFLELFGNAMENGQNSPRLGALIKLAQVLSALEAYSALPVQTVSARKAEIENDMGLLISITGALSFVLSTMINLKAYNTAQLLNTLQERMARAGERFTGKTELLDLQNSWLLPLADHPFLYTMGFTAFAVTISYFIYNRRGNRQLQEYSGSVAAPAGAETYAGLIIKQKAAAQRIYYSRIIQPLSIQLVDEPNRGPFADALAQIEFGTKAALCEKDMQTAAQTPAIKVRVGPVEEIEIDVSEFETAQTDLYELETETNNAVRQQRYLRGGWR